MARLNRRLRGAGGRDRAQFLLLGAFGVAVLLLVLAGVVNTVTYTAVTHDREHPTSRDVAAFQDDVRRGAEGILERVNEGSDDYDDTVDEFADSVDSWEDGADRAHLTDATGVTIAVEGTTEGARITQSAEGRPLTNAAGDGDWTLVASTDETRSFELELDRESLTEGSCSSNECFELAVEGEVVTVSESEVAGSTGRCDIDSDPVRIDAVEGTLDGEECDALDDIEQAQEDGGSYDIEYDNGENASGTYGLVVRGSVPDDGDYSEEPSVTPIIYGAEVGIDYRSPRLAYANEISVRGGGG